MPACEKQKQNLSFCFWETICKSEFYETKKQSAEIKKQFSELEGLTNILVGIVDIDENPALAKEYKIGAYPTFILFKNGIEVTRFSGLHTKYDLINKVMTFLN